MHSSKQSVYIFPEGTRSYYDCADLLPFKKGAFHLAIQAQVPIVPIVVANYSHILNTKKKTFRPGVISVLVLEPIPTLGLRKEDVDGLLEKTRDRMLTALAELSGQTRQAGVAVETEEKSRQEHHTNGLADGNTSRHDAHSSGIEVKSSGERIQAQSSGIDMAKA